MSSSQSRSRGRKRSSSTLRSKTSNTTAKSTGPYDRAFQQHLVDHGIYPDGYEYPDGSVPPPPDNMEEIQQAIARPRRSLSPSRFTDEDFREFKRADARADARACKENQVTTLVIPIIEGKARDGRFSCGQIPFRNLHHLTDGSLVPGNPDLYYGARPEQLSRRIRTELNGHVVPSTQHDLPVVPNFFLAAKGPDGSSAVATRQACYDGALGARGIHTLGSYGELDAVFENKAYTITCTYVAGQPKMYTSHPIQPASSESCPGYSMTQIDSWSLTGNSRAFREGAAAFRNLADWAEKRRNEVIEEANVRIRTGQAATTTVSVTSSFTAEATIDVTKHSQGALTPRDHESNVFSFCDSDTSTDELSLPVLPPPKCSKTQLPRKRQHPAITSGDVGHGR